MWRDKLIFFLPYFFQLLFQSSQPKKCFFKVGTIKNPADPAGCVQHATGPFHKQKAMLFRQQVLKHISGFSSWNSQKEN
jgi:hypothetical protein